MATGQLDRVSALLRSEDPRDRLRGLQDLARLSRDLGPSERVEARGLLAPLASDPQPFVRWNATVAAGLIGGGEAVELLTTEAQAGDEHANTRFRVALALGLLSDPRGLPVLERYAEDPYQIEGHFVVRAFAALALGMLGDPGGIPALKALAADEDPVVRWHTAVALGDIAHPDGVETLVALTEDPVPFVRAHAAIGLGVIGSPDGLEAVRRLAGTDEVERVRRIAAESLALFAGEPG
ncbi:MAG: HEAT repeat domain-containing protein [Actinomycetota bacterium]